MCVDIIIGTRLPPDHVRASAAPKQPARIYIFSSYFHTHTHTHANKCKHFRRIEFGLFSSASRHSECDECVARWFLWWRNKQLLLNACTFNMFVMCTHSTHILEKSLVQTCVLLNDVSRLTIVAFSSYRAVFHIIALRMTSMCVCVIVCLG